MGIAFPYCQHQYSDKDQSVLFSIFLLSFDPMKSTLMAWIGTISTDLIKGANWSLHTVTLSPIVFSNRPADEAAGL